jgi:ketosteroid isomerase-like protein
MAGDLIMHAKVDGKKLALKMRWTGVLEKRGGKWLLVQLHNSLPAAAQAAGQSFPTS